MAEIAMAAVGIGAAASTMSIILGCRTLAADIARRKDDLLTQVGTFSELRARVVRLTDSLEILEQHARNAPYNARLPYARCMDDLLKILTDIQECTIGYLQVNRMQAKLKISNAEYEKRFKKLDERLSTCVGDLLLCLQISIYHPTHAGSGAPHAGARNKFEDREGGEGEEKEKEKWQRKKEESEWEEKRAMVGKNKEEGERQGLWTDTDGKGERKGERDVTSYREGDNYREGRREEELEVGRGSVHSLRTADILKSSNRVVEENLQPSAKEGTTGVDGGKVVDVRKERGWYGEEMLQKVGQNLKKAMSFGRNDGTGTIGLLAAKDRVEVKK
jgi:hypothetical protein